MANLGAIARAHVLAYQRPEAVGRGIAPQPVATHLATSLAGTISGTITLGALPVANARVNLYLLNGLLIATTFTDASGNYSFNRLDPSFSGGYIVTVRDSTNTYNMGRLDRMTAG